MSLSAVIKGKVWKFGDHVSTTDITPGEMFMSTDFKAEEIVFAALRPDWKDQVRPGDCIVAGKNFGFGSHRAMANEVMKDLGIGCVAADSIARIYYRNAIAMGFPALACPGVSDLFSEGDDMELDVRSGEIRNLTTG
ncbi:MAG: 3-isopropylmalate dehydratase small subunit, partial [Peptococcaceae bacterium]|nr:3-isopropylmalate dehydratase small subunit [Peptococcaceae bacterium]